MSTNFYNFWHIVANLFRCHCPKLQKLVDNRLSYCKNKKGIGFFRHSVDNVTMCSINGQRIHLLKHYEYIAINNSSWYVPHWHVFKRHAGTHAPRAHGPIWIKTNTYKQIKINYDTLSTTIQHIHINITALLLCWMNCAYQTLIM